MVPPAGAVGLDAGRCHRSRGAGRCLGRGRGRWETSFDQCGELLGNGHLHTPLEQGLGSLHLKGGVIGAIGLQFGGDDGEAVLIGFAFAFGIEMNG